MIINNGGGSGNAKSTKYDNTESGLQATNVQEAVDELNQSLPKNYGARVNITDRTIYDNRYKFPSNGILIIATGLNTGTNNVAANIYDENDNQIMVIGTNNTNNSIQTVCVPVFSGMSAYVSAISGALSGAFFYPYVY